MTNALHTNKESPFRLELIYDEKTETAKLQGNKVGLRHLKHLMENLIADETPPGAHHHFDVASNLTYSNMSLIIELLDE